MYEVCVNPACARAKAAEEFAIGTSVCPECGGDLEVRDPNQLGGLANLIRKGLQTAAPLLQGLLSGDSDQDASVDVLTVSLTILGVVPRIFQDSAEQLSWAFVFDNSGSVRPVSKGPMYGDCLDGQIKLGALQPQMDWRPSLDLAAYCAFSPNLTPDGDRIPVAVSRHMATITLQDNKLIIEAANASNRPKLIDQVSWTAGHSMKAGDTMELEDGAMFQMGDFVLQFHIQTQ